MNLGSFIISIFIFISCLYTHDQLYVYYEDTHGLNICKQIIFNNTVEYSWIENIFNNIYDRQLETKLTRCYQIRNLCNRELCHNPESPLLKNHKLYFNNIDCAVDNNRSVFPNDNYIISGPSLDPVEIKLLNYSFKFKNFT